MANKIKWETEMEIALKRAKSENKSVLLDFFNPGWIGCQQMDAVSYPDTKVTEFINGNIVPLRVHFDAQPLSSDFNVQWTPTLVTLDRNGKEHHRTVGFLPPEELIPSLILGLAKTHFDLSEFKEALECLEKIVSDFPKSDATPEAIYLRGVSRYKSTHDAKGLKKAYELLQSRYPGSEWTKRAFPYRLL